MKKFEDYGIIIPRGQRHGQVKTQCPNCSGTRSNPKDKSLSVNLDEGVWKCHHCEWSGKLEYTDEEKREWAERQHKNETKMKKEYKKPAPRLETVMSEKAIAWFKSRGIGKDTLDALKVTEGMEYMPQDQKQRNTVQFNYYRDGELVNTKFRTGDKHFKMVQGAELIPYNLDGIKGTPECIITEGEMDAMSFYECGRHDVVSVPNGANANLSYLDDYIEDYFDDKECIYIASDTDTKGLILRDELVRRLGCERCKIVTYGDDCKDANEHLQKYGQQSLLKCLENAQEIKIEGVFTVSDFEQSLDSLFENGLQRGVTIGHYNFDQLMSFETKRLCLVTGIPGSGKSEFIDEIAERLNMRYGWKFAYFSPENAPLALHASKLIEKFTGKKFSRQTLPSAEYRQVKEHIEENFFFISPKEDFRVESILERAKFLVKKRGIRALVIDPYNRLENEQGSLSETQYISKLLDKLTNFAQQNDILVILMAHPTKMKRGTDGKIEEPTLYDISGSAHFFNKCDFGLIVHRVRGCKEEEEKVIVRVAKVKFRHLGQVGTADFKYNINNGRYVPFYGEAEGAIKWDNTNHLVEVRMEQEMQAAENSFLDFGGNDDSNYNTFPY